MMKVIKIVILGIALLSYMGCNSKTDDNVEENKKVEKAVDGEHNTKNELAHWSYSGAEGPEKWANLCPAYAPCNGKRQSPINLSSALSDKANVTIDRTYNCVSDIELVNNGHSVQVNFVGDAVNVLTVNNKPFVLKQFHFHCPSEHTIDGKHFDSEAHFVHVADDGEISVIGVFINEGSKSEFLEKIIKNIPVHEGDKNIITEEICPANVFSTEDKYYVYEGSLTTPPCTEGVNWFVRKKSIEASKEQIEALKNVMPANNIRPVQPLNDREFGKLD